MGSWTRLTIDLDLMVVSCSSPKCPPSLKLGFLPPAGYEAVSWVSLEESEPVPEIEWRVLTFTSPLEQENQAYHEPALLPYNNVHYIDRQTDRQTFYSKTSTFFREEHSTTTQNMRPCSLLC
ncbi:acylamino-acid-releasing enzyme-like [Polyodon spathula]|uniref:acylamino-acid-releasing enzyme-like n=1 Tax=Polyodon spathula TaxID=7913 RepID=UPI001B7E42A9|nr:acylamino-acid-releasing enzyme-like [Polyodon spathula]